jgi:hypothetical protein
MSRAMIAVVIFALFLVAAFDSCGSDDYVSPDSTVPTANPPTYPDDAPGWTPAPLLTEDVTEAPADDEPDVYYRSCAEAKRAGVTPLKRGEPGYRKGLDRDGDGWACDGE